ncbi:MAG: hypothetical protein QXW58_00340 [Thermosphaera sp.]
MRLLYVELSPGLKRKDIFDRIESVHRSLSYRDVEIGLLTARGATYLLKTLRYDSLEVHASASLGELLRVFFRDCKRVYVLREGGEALKPVEPCYVSGVYSDPPHHLEGVLESVDYSPAKLSLGPTPYLASSLIPILYRLNELEHIFNTFVK